MDGEIVVAPLDAPEVIEDVVEAQAEIVETEAEVAIAAIDASVEIAQIEADAAVAMVEAQSEVEEIDTQWLGSQFDGVNTSLASLNVQVLELREILTALAAATILPPPPSIPTSPSAEAVTVEPPSEPEAVIVDAALAPAPVAARPVVQRVRRLI